MIGIGRLLPSRGPAAQAFVLVPRPDGVTRGRRKFTKFTLRPPEIAFHHSASSSVLPLSRPPGFQAGVGGRDGDRLGRMHIAVDNQKGFL